MVLFGNFGTWPYEKHLCEIISNLTCSLGGDLVKRFFYFILSPSGNFVGRSITVWLILLQL